MEDNYSPAAFPLIWPEHWHRTPANKRRQSRFGDRGLYTACQKLKEELLRFGAVNIILSTSVPLRRDGMPLAKPPVDNDPGAAVYYSRNGKSECLAADIYADVIDNVWALLKVIESLRTIERHGSPEILERAFMGFSALPAKTTRHWTSVLDVSGNATAEEIRSAFRAKAKSMHSDQGGNDEIMRELIEARDAALEEIAKLPVPA